MWLLLSASSGEWRPLAAPGRVVDTGANHERSPRDWSASRSTSASRPEGTGTFPALGDTPERTLATTSTIRSFHSEVVIEPESANGLEVASAAQCQHVRAVSPDRIVEIRGNVGVTVLTQIRETIAVILDVP